MVALVFTLAFVCGASAVTTWAFMRGRAAAAREEGYNKGFAEGVESQRRWNAHKVPEKKLIKIEVPNFGAPSLKIYSPIDYMGPLECTSCKETLVVGDDFYEIPIVNKPGTYAAVHLRCERKEMYGNAPNNSADVRQPRKVLGDPTERGSLRRFWKSIQGSDGRAQ